MLAALLLLAPVLTVDQVVARHGELNGQVVEVRGLLPVCAALDCALWPPPPPGRPVWINRGLSIAPDSGFDRLAAPFVGHEVVLTARLDDACLKPGTVCVDRTTELIPVGPHPLRLLETQ